MAYARLYRCDRLTLLYPAIPGHGSHTLHQFGLAQGRERLSIMTLDLIDPLGLDEGLRRLLPDAAGHTNTRSLNDTTNHSTRPYPSL
jgi:5-methylcytosine-specific restriction enzyme subunit McrC